MKNRIVFVLLNTFFFFAVPISAIKIKDARNIGKMVNSKYNEFAPTLNKDGNILIFNSKRDGYSFQNLYQSLKVNGSWSTPKYISSVNSRYNDETPVLSADGQMLVFSSDRDGSFVVPKDSRGRVRVSFDLYWSFKRNNQWSYPQKIPRINSRLHQRTPSLSTDGKYLYYMQWPFGKIKKATLYQAQILPNNEIGNIKKITFPKDIKNMHLGVQPNQNNNGFYFSSQLADSLGGWDLYHISFEHGVFGKPQNLGSKINSKKNEVYFNVFKNQIYFCSNREGGEGKFDIYGASIPPQSRNIYFKQFDALTLKATSEKFLVKLFSQQGKLLSQKIINNFNRGTFFIEVPLEASSMQISSSSNKFLPYQKKIAIASKSKFFSKFTPHKIKLQSPKSNQSFDIYAIRFEYNSSNLTEKSIEYLRKLSKFLVKKPNLKFKIIGHTDLHGSQKFNFELSNKRANAVKKFLIKHGIAKFRIKTSGAGKKHPVINKISPIADNLNRRTEFKFLSAD